MPVLNQDKTILIVAHGNSLRSITKYIENISNEDIPNYEIPTGIPIEYILKDKQIIQKRKL